jgi:hypothetical protein
MMSRRARRAFANAIVESENRRIRRLRRALNWALTHAKWWQGCMEPDDPTYAEFEKKINYCKKVLKEVKPQ